MAFTSIFKDGVDISKDFILDHNREIEDKFSYLTDAPTSFFHSKAPFALSFTTYSHQSDNPFRYVVISPNFVMNTVLSETEFNTKVLNRPMHQHDTYELMYVLDGELYQRIDNTRHRFIKDSCCLINRNVRHTEEYINDFHILNCSFSPEFLQELSRERRDSFFAPISDASSVLTDFIFQEFETGNLPDKKYIDFSPVNSEIPNQSDIRPILDRITCEVLAANVSSTIMIKALFCKIMNILDDETLYLPVSMSLGTASETKLFSEITNLMEQTHGRISRSQLAEKLNYSGTYINQIVQKFSGCSTFEYGTSFTMKHAVHLLLNTNRTTSQIIDELGFTDRTHFYRLFENEYHMTPAKYRKQFRK